MNRRAFLLTSAVCVPSLAVAGKLGPPSDDEPVGQPSPTLDTCAVPDLTQLPQEQLLAGKKCAQAVVDAYDAEITRRKMPR